MMVGTNERTNERTTMFDRSETRSCESNRPKDLRFFSGFRETSQHLSISVLASPLPSGRKNQINPLHTSRREEVPYLLCWASSNEPWSTSCGV